MRRAFVLLGWCTSAWALNPELDVSQYAHTAWKLRDGFPKAVVRAIAQTPDGYLWLGTESGLFRFDGVKATQWQPPQREQSLSEAVGSLLAGRDGSLWIGTQKRLVRWKDGALTQYPEFDGYIVSRLLEDREGTVWAAGYRIPAGRLCAIRPGRLECDGQDGSFGNGIQGLYQDREGNLWVGIPNGVWRWKPGPPKFYPQPGNADGTPAFAETDEGAILISVRGEIRRLANGTMDAWPVTRKFSLDRAEGFLRDRDGAMWIATDRGILHTYKGTTDQFAAGDGLSGDGARAILEDREGSIWVVTTAGLDRFREFAAATFTTKQGLSNFRGGSILAAADGSVWVGGRNVTRWRPGSALAEKPFREVVPAASLGTGVMSLFEDSRARVWVAALDSIGYIEKERLQLIPGLPGGFVHSITEDTAGNLWFANQNLGLFRLSPDHQVQRIPWTQLGHADSAGKVAADPLHGGIWLGFRDSGIGYFADGQMRASYTSAQGLGQGRVNGLRVDPDGTLWSATDGGLSRLKNNRIETLTPRNGLPCAPVHWSVEDDDHSLWLYMPCGLARIGRSELDAWIADPKHVVALTTFDPSDGVGIRGLPSGYSPVITKAVDGKLWFAADDGMSVIDPRHLPFNQLPPPVRIEQISANHKPYEIPPDGMRVRLPALLRDLEIDYTALSLAAPEKVRFRYKLENHDRDWEEAGNRRQAFYTDLDPGDYRFRVMASNSSGVWNEAGTALDFSIEPMYYQTRWFQAAWVAALLAMLWGLYRYRVHQIAREFNVRLEERVGERTRIARDLHDSLLQSFQGLMLRLQVVDDLLPPGKAKDQLEQTLLRADQAIEEGRSTVYDLRSSATTTNDLAQAIRSLGEELATPDSAAFRLVVEGPSRDLHPIIRDEIYRISREALRNAFVHARARRIETEITYGDRAFSLRIRDDGEGFPPEILEEGRPGHYGLTGMRERAGKIGGQLEIWSRARAGTEVELSIPGSIAYGASTGPRLFDLFRRKAG